MDGEKFAEIIEQIINKEDIDDKEAAEAFYEEIWNKIQVARYHVDIQE